MFIKPTFIAMIILLAGCNQKINLTPSIFKNNKIEINNIVANSKPRQTNINLQNIPIERLYPIDSISVKGLLNETITSDTLKLSLPYNQYGRYYLYDHADFKDKFLFTMMYKDENGYNILIQFTADKKSGKINYAELIGVTGGDAGDATNDSLVFNDSGDKLTVISSSISEDIGNGEPNTIQYDSVVRKFDFRLDKRFISIIHHSTRTDTLAD